ncbi:MAG: PrsW family glutamic-type intramembrane protease [Acidobacteriota bacterium]
MGGLRELILIPILSLIPCALWLWYFASQSRYKRPSPRVIGLTFLFGALATIPAFIISFTGQSLWISLFGRNQLTHLAILCFIVAPVEELVKLLAVYAYAYRRPEFDEPLDGVIYSASAALGFAAIENLIYFTQSSPLLVLLRGPLTNPGHALFSALWGLSLSRAKAAPNLAGKRFSIIAVGWLLATMLHATFDLLLMAAAEQHLLFFGVLAGAMILLFFWVRARIHFYRDASPHREGTMLVQNRVFCQECGKKGMAGTQCSGCGNHLPEPEEMVLCPLCTTQQRPGAKFCSRCGADMRVPAAENLNTRPHFVVIAPGGEERIAYVLNRDEIQIGRTLNNQFVVEHPSVSKRHARVVADASDYALHDLGSINGTFVNGRRITTARLEDGCEVRFGHASFVYRAPQT